MVSVTVSAVYQAIEEAIETALRHDYTIEQIEGVFQEVIDKFKHKGESKSDGKVD
ncbi:hypothetical protein [Cytobacillus citreus]